MSIKRFAELFCFNKIAFYLVIIGDNGIKLSTLVNSKFNTFIFMVVHVSRYLDFEILNKFCRNKN